MACKEQNKKMLEEKVVDQEQEYLLFGDFFDLKNDISANKMSENYKSISVLDTLQTKFTATVTDVCKAKGCWMKLKLNNKDEEEDIVMVKFKDYGFFVPKDIIGKQVVVNGKAFVTQMSIEVQKHYAMDGGEPEEVIALITKPKKTYGFNATGVLLKK
jgi:hypothetical protein